MHTAEAETLLGRLSRPWLPGEAPWLDQDPASPETTEQASWSELGYVVLRGLIHPDLIDAYVAEWQEHNADRPLGWTEHTVTPYTQHPALRTLCCDSWLAAAIESILGEPGGVHLNLTGWRSTERNWHQDGYLNPDSNKDHYVAAWIALDDIHPDAGPFEFIPGSHRKYGAIRHDLMLDALEPHERGSDWPWHSERLLTPMFEALMARDRVIPARFYATKGDVLLWHSRLLHRGSAPKDTTLERRALIAHYSGIHHRPDMPPAVQHPFGGYYFPL